MSLAGLLSPVPWRLVGAFALTAALAGAFGAYTAHERGVGAAKCVQAGERVVVKEAAHVGRQEAAGAAAALAARHGITPRAVDRDELRKELKEQNAIV